MSGYHTKTHFPYHFCVNCCDSSGKQVIKNDNCVICHGTGKPCQECNGSGVTKKEVKCSTCHQTTSIIEKPCPKLKI